MYQARSKLIFTGTANCIAKYLKRGTRIVIYVARYWKNAKHICMQSIPNLGGSGGMPPRKFWKISPSEVESESIFSDLAKLQIQQNFLKVHKIYLVSQLAILRNL